MVKWSTDNEGVRGYRRCIIELIHKLQRRGGSAQVRTGLTKWIYHTISNSLCPFYSHSLSVFTYLVLALRATDWQAVRAEPLNMADKCMVGGQSGSTLSTPDNTDFSRHYQMKWNTWWGKTWHALTVSFHLIPKKRVRDFSRAYDIRE